jgi:hypothetical protein
VAKFSQGPLRFLGLTLSGVGAALCIALLILDEHRELPEGLLLLIFLALAVVFWYVPRLTVRLRAAIARLGERSCRRSAVRFVRAATALAPYEAEYELDGDKLIYFRCKGEDRILAWQRQLTKFRSLGAAIQANNVTAIFRRPTSFLPAVVVLHVDSEWTRNVLERVGIPVSSLNSAATN